MTSVVRHSRLTRAQHWINAALALTLLMSGFGMFGADRGFAWITHFVPAGVWSALRLGASRRAAFSLHTLVGALFALNGLFYLVALIRTGGWKRLARGLPERFGALSYALEQRASYLGAIGLAAVMVLTGLLLWFKHPLAPAVRALGGDHVLLPVHVVCAAALLAFAFAHVVQVVRHGRRTLAAMLPPISRRFAGGSSGSRTPRTLPSR